METTIFPNDFIDVLQHDFPNHAHSLLKALSTDAPTSVLLNTKKIEKRPDLPVVGWNANGFYLPQRPSFTSDPLFHAGAYYPQEASSMFIGSVMQHLKPSLHRPLVLDLCAAPGGKSIATHQQLPEEAFLVANEIHPQRCKILQENLTRWGIQNMLITNNKPEDFEVFSGAFDVVIVDAPCSGEGMFRKDKNAIAEWSSQNVNQCALRQKSILQSAKKLVKPNGYLIYSTCTFNSLENEQQAKNLLAEKEFLPVEIPLNPDWNIETQKELGMYRFFPHLLQGEGFTSFVFQKQMGKDFIQEKRNKRNSAFKYWVKKVQTSWYSPKEEENHLMYANEIFAVTQAEIIQEIDFNLLYIKQLGLPILEQSKNLILPHGLLHLSDFSKNANLPSVELNIDDAQKFLLKAPLYLKNIPMQWVFMTFEKIKIGLAKNLGNRINNYYPKELKIRQQNLSDFSLFRQKTNEV